MQSRTLTNDEVNAQVLRSRQMLAQTQAQGSTPFAGSSYDVPQRTIQGTPSSIAVPGNENTQQQISPDFNTRLIGLLKQYQTMGTKPFQEKAIAGQQEQVARQQTTPEDMIGASPSQQGAVRDASVSAVQPTINSAQQQGKTFSEQLNSFGDTVNTVQNMLKEQHAQQDKERDDARNIVQNAFTTFGSKATDILDPKIFKAAGYEASVLTNIKDTLKEQEMAQKLQISEQNNLTRQQIAAMKQNPTSPGQQTEYATDLDAVIGSALSVIPTKFGQSTFMQQIGKARNDADKINLVASQVLKGQPAEVRRDFANQAVGISEIDKAIQAIDSGTKTGVLRAGAQYTFNIFGKDFDSNLTKVNAHIIAAIQPYRNSVTGAAWGQQEDQEYAQLFGSTKYSPSELKTRLETLKDILKSKSAITLNTFVNPMGTNQNYFNTGAYSGNVNIQDIVRQNATIEGKTAYLPREIWDTLGTEKDAILAEAEADGYQLLIR